MRFAIAILCVLALASVAGTIVPQNQPLAVYLSQFGPFWTAVFDRAGVFGVYGSAGYVTLLAFLVLSTSLCLTRHTPRLWRDVRRWRVQSHAGALRALPHCEERRMTLAPAAAAEDVGARLKQSGWRWRTQSLPDGSVWLAARRGRYGRLGYVAAHGAVVLIALGGLLDGDALLRVQMLWQGVTPFPGGGLIASVPAQHRLGPNTLAYRASLFVPEGARTGSALIARPDGVVVQELPFQIELNRFHIDYWDNGMPRRFVSTVQIHSGAGPSRTATVEVNRPLTVDGVTIYQSSFEDGGSRVGLMAWPLSPAALMDSAQGGALGFRLAGTVGGPPLSLPQPLLSGSPPMTLELSDYRSVNVSPVRAGLGGADGAGASWWQRLVAPARPARLDETAAASKAAADQGPLLAYRWRDEAGQARDFDATFKPVLQDGVPTLRFGARDPRDPEGAPLRVLRIPVDDTGMRGWMRVLQALYDPRQRARAVERASRSVPAAEQAVWQASATRALALFAGALSVPVTPQLAADRAAAGFVGPDRLDRPLGGYAAVQAFLQTVPQAQRPALSALLLGVLDDSLRALVAGVRADAGVPPWPTKLQEQPTDALRWSLLRTSLSDQFFYPAPALIQGLTVQPVHASVFEVARAPGRWLVYPGSALLALGVVAMLFVRDRRLWLLLQPSGPGASLALVALTAPKPSASLAREWAEVLPMIFDKENPDGQSGR